MDWMAISQIGLWILMLIMLVFMYLLMRMIGQFLYRFRLVPNQIQENTLNVGQLAPLFRSKNQFGQTIRLAEHSKEFTLLVFAQDTCPVCHRIIKQLPLQIEPFDVRCIIIYPKKIDEEQLEITLDAHLIESSEAFDNYFIQKVPSLFLVNENNEILGIFDDSNIDSLPTLLQKNIIQSGKTMSTL